MILFNEEYRFKQILLRYFLHSIERTRKHFVYIHVFIWFRTTYKLSYAQNCKTRNIHSVSSMILKCTRSCPHPCGSECKFKHLICFQLSTRREEKNEIYSWQRGEQQVHFFSMLYCSNLTKLRWILKFFLCLSL